MKIHRFFYYTLLLLLPTQLGYHFWPSFSLIHGIRIDYLAPTMYLTDIIVFGIIISWLLSEISNLKFQISNKLQISNYKSPNVYSLIFGYLLLNTFLASNPALAVIRLLTVFELAFLILYITKTKPSLRRTIYCLLVTICYASILAWVQFTTQGSVGGILWWLGERTFTKTTPGIATAFINGNLILRPYATFPHPNVLAGFIVTIIPLLWLLKSFRKHLLFIPILLCIVATVIITLSRSAWLVILVLIVVLVFFLIKQQNRLTLRPSHSFAYLFICLFVYLTTPFLYNRFAHLTSVDMQSITLRSELNQAAIAIIRDHPLVGVGLNNFLINLPAYHPIRTYQDIQPVHNIYLLALAELGFIGVGIIFILLLYIYGLKKRQIQNTTYNILLSLCSLLLLGLFDHYPYTIHQMNLLGAVILGFIFSSPKRPNTLVQ